MTGLACKPQQLSKIMEQDPTPMSLQSDTRQGGGEGGGSGEVARAQGKTMQSVGIGP